MAKFKFYLKLCISIKVYKFICTSARAASFLVQRAMSHSYLLQEKALGCQKLVVFLRKEVYNTFLRRKNRDKNKFTTGLFSSNSVYNFEYFGWQDLNCGEGKETWTLVQGSS